MEKVVIGKVLRPRGLKGELKILSLITEHETLKNLDTVFVGDKLFSVKKITMQPGTGIAFMFLDGIDHIDKAEELRDQEIEVALDDVELHDESEWEDVGE